MHSSKDLDVYHTLFSIFIQSTCQKKYLKYIGVKRNWEKNFYNLFDNYLNERETNVSVVLIGNALLILL